MAVLLIGAGNSNCRIARVCGQSVRAVRVWNTARVLAGPERFLNGLTATDAALASVVPRVTRPVARALVALTGRSPFMVNARSRTGLAVRYDRRSLGADRLCAAEGARVRWTGDIAVVDFGTAVTVNFVSGSGVFEGGPIMPGPGIMLDALRRSCAGIPKKAGAPWPEAGVCGPGFPRTTRAAVSAGVLAAVAGGVMHTLTRVELRTGKSWRLVGTGGNVRRFARYLPRLSAIDPLLGCRGLHALYRLNREG